MPSPHEPVPPPPELWEDDGDDLLGDGAAEIFNVVENGRNDPAPGGCHNGERNRHPALPPAPAKRGETLLVNRDVQRLGPRATHRARILDATLRRPIQLSDEDDCPHPIDVQCHENQCYCRTAHGADIGARTMYRQCVHFVIMGCGRVGASIASNLEASGHSVAVIDQNVDAFRRLPADFSGRRITGIGFDRDALSQAGIEEAYAFAAVSSGDNSNIIAARVAREQFGVERVVARIYDPRRAQVFQRLGITTIATVRWTTDQFLRRLLPKGTSVDFEDSSGAVSIASVDYHPRWVGRSVANFETYARCRVAYITRLGTGFVPSTETQVQDGDILNVAVSTADLSTLRRAAMRSENEVLP